MDDELCEGLRVGHGFGGEDLTLGQGRRGEGLTLSRGGMVNGKLEAHINTKQSTLKIKRINKEIVSTRSTTSLK